MKEIEHIGQSNDIGGRAGSHDGVSLSKRDSMTQHISEGTNESDRADFLREPQAQTLKEFPTISKSDGKLHSNMMANDYVELKFSNNQSTLSSSSVQTPSAANQKLDETFQDPQTALNQINEIGSTISDDISTVKLENSYIKSEDKISSGNKTTKEAHKIPINEDHKQSTFSNNIITLSDSVKNDEINNNTKEIRHRDSLNLFREKNKNMLSGTFNPNPISSNTNLNTEYEKDISNGSSNIYKKQKKTYSCNERKFYNETLFNGSEPNISSTPEDLFYNLEIIPENILENVESEMNRIVHIYVGTKCIPLNRIQPPVNLEVLKEVELKENLKNVQLRHDIVFDPYLQFKPNVEGERGIKKRENERKYWNYLFLELIVLFNSPRDFDPFNSLLLTMFKTLRDIVASLLKDSELSAKDGSAMNDEIENLNHNISPINIVTNLHQTKTFDIEHFADYLKFIMQKLCAPMRDPLIDTLHQNLINIACVLEADYNSREARLFSGILNQFQFAFKILELMKLDIANHQIRLIRPALLSNCVNYERQFFDQVIFLNGNINRNSLVSWIYFPLEDSSESSNQNEISENKLNNVAPIYWKNIFKYQTNSDTKLKVSIKTFFNKIYIANVLRLISCCSLTKNMPSLLRFDVTRLCLLRSDLRECICLLIVRFLYKQLIYDDKSLTDDNIKRQLISMYETKQLKTEILGIIVDESGSFRWTNNVTELSLYLLNKIEELKSSLGVVQDPSYDSITSKLSFTQNWLQNQIQPSSAVYKLLEYKIFKNIMTHVSEKCNVDDKGVINPSFLDIPMHTFDKDNQSSININRNAESNNENAGMHSTTNEPSGPSEAHGNEDYQGSMFDISEVVALKSNMLQLISLNWSVMGDKYIELFQKKVEMF